jgi:hypothetical protein
MDFPPISYMHSSSPHLCYMPCPSHPQLDHSTYDRIFNFKILLWSNICWIKEYCRNVPVEWTIFSGKYIPVSLTFLFLCNFLLEPVEMVSIC